MPKSKRPRQPRSEREPSMQVPGRESRGHEAGEGGSDLASIEESASCAPS